MKVLIVDDEHHVVDAVILLVPWERLGISEVLSAFSVDEAQRILEREKPEIAIVDVMIGDRMGIELLACINKLELLTKVIVISGYDDYQYIRNMFVMGGIEYLLKPIEQEPLIEAVKIAIEKYKSVASPHLTDYQRSLHRSLLLGSSNGEIYRQICEGDDSMRGISCCYVLYADCYFLPIWSEEYMLELNLTIDVVRQDLESERNGTLFQMSTNLTDIVILLYQNFEEMLEYIARCLRKFNRGKNLSLCFGCGETQNFPDGIMEAFRQAKIAAEYVQKDDKRLVLRYKPDFKEMKMPVETREEEQLFSLLILGGEREQIDRALKRWLVNIFRETNGRRGEIKKIWEYFQFLSEKWNRYFENRYPGYRRTPVFHFWQLGQKLAEKPDGSVDFVEIFFLVFRDNIQKISLEKKRVQGSRSKMREIADYLEINYASRIQQTECARLFHLNKDYMSRKFKEEIGVGMVEYVNRVRIKKAIELLGDTDKSIQEIADSTGFIDPKYFAKQFKKETHLTPAEYRTMIVTSKTSNDS